ncbi:uncharacterized protein LOC142552873 [Primulina tabacum]|uniref:uncharacterized protein LOC142552873 n=1 Tax=Primulina tabacum TaxID=48773 RepID=UPI003F5966C9
MKVVLKEVALLIHSHAYECLVNIVHKTEQLTTLDGMNWIQRKIYLYNVTFGLYMLDWWERYLFNTLVVVLMWFIFYNSSRYVTDFCRGHLQ